jgi:hypothetical protein
MNDDELRAATEAATNGKTATCIRAAGEEIRRDLIRQLGQAVDGSVLAEVWYGLGADDIDEEARLIHEPVEAALREDIRAALTLADAIELRGPL